ncbi:MAG: ParB/RepB/Spo0J family partition protein [Alphaproteobacteria bacterium]|nr:ParB/RepB/Spo0J family partition protein [Alphaproteobacteria bacterium]
MMNTKANKKQRGLGKGLDQLLTSSSELVEKTIATSGATELPLSCLVAGISQPRKYFDDEALEGLASSISEKGVLQPLLVRPLQGDTHEIIAGERRFRAAKRAGLSSVPVAIMSLTDTEAFEIALIENVQRQDLSTIEEAEGYMQMIDKFDYTQERISKIVGKSRSHITNTLRLLLLPEEVKTMVDDGHLSVGHARTLIGMDNANELALEIINSSLNVRETEEFISSRKEKKKSNKTTAKADEINKLEQDSTSSLTESLKRDVSVKIRKNNSGKIVINFENQDDLNELVKKLSL